MVNSIVNPEMTISHLNRTLLHKMHFTIELRKTKSKIKSKGKNELMNTLKRNLLEPNMFSLDCSRKQSNETIISED